MSVHTPEYTEIIQSFGWTPIIPAELAEPIAQVTVVPIQGPNGIGKTSTMREIIKMDAAFHYVPTITSRERRDDDKEGDYDYVSHNAQGFRELWGAIKEEGIVQGTRHPNGSLYATLPGDYIDQACSSPFAVFAPIRTEIYALRRAGFAAVKPMVMVAHPAEFEPRLLKRKAQLSPESFRANIKENRDSLQMWLERGTDDVSWIANNTSSDGRPTAAANEIIRIARGWQEPNPQARKLGAALFKYIDGIYYDILDYRTSSKA